MSENLYMLAVDVGTSSLKAAFITVDGDQRAFAREAYPPQRGGGVGDWEAALEKALARLFTASAASPAAVCISANGPTLVPFTFAGEALPPLWWYDERLVKRSDAASFFLPHAAFFAQNEARRYEEIRYFFSAQEWLSFRLGAEPVTVLPQPAYGNYYWNDQQCRLFGLNPAQFPQFVAMGSVIGRVSFEAAGRFKLKAGIPIIAGGPDFIMALIGAGALENGVACDRAGTSEGINLCVEGFLPPEMTGLRVLPHIQDGLWNIGGIIPRSGSLFDEYRLKSGWWERDYDELLREIIAAKSEGFAVLELMAEQVKNILKLFARNGFPLTELRVSGGQGKNRCWNQLKANLTGCPLIVPAIVDGELAGNAALAAVALGEAATIQEAVKRLFRIREKYDPLDFLQGTS